jgi:hypothetical protein
MPRPWFHCRSDPVESLSFAADFSSGQAHSPLSLGSRVPQADLLSTRQTLFHLIFLNKPPVLPCSIRRFFYFPLGDFNPVSVTLPALRSVLSFLILREVT